MHTNSNTHPRVFFTFLKLYKWYQMAQNIVLYWYVQRYPSYKIRFMVGEIMYSKVYNQHSLQVSLLETF